MKIFSKIIVFTVSLPVYFYRLILAPLMPKSCAFYPSCSTYALESIKRHGPVIGWGIAIKRLMRCRPFGAKNGGYDPVPYKHGGGAKWVI
jgi:putative membrane protein insertion efficiency factor